MIQVSDKMKTLKGSPTLILAAKAKALAKEGKSVVSLAVGEPDWPTLECASVAGIEAIKTGVTKYTPAEGLLELRELLCQSLKEETGIGYTPHQVTVTSGAKFVISSALNVLLNPGDEVLIPAPYWVSYPTMVELAGGTPKIVETGIESHFKLTPKALESAIGPRTKGLLFNSPSNPTGLLYTEQELLELSKVIKRHPGLFVISDDMYNKLILEGEIAPHLLRVCPELVSQMVVVNGASKSYSMTGWRLGWAAGPEPVIKAMSNYQSQVLGCASSIAQKATMAALKHSAEDLKSIRKTLKQRAEAAVKGLETVDGFRVMKPEGAFYLWVNVEPLIQSGFVSSDMELCQQLLEQKYVVTVPGSEFGAPGNLRMSFAVSNEDMSEAIQRMADHCRGRVVNAHA